MKSGPEIWMSESSYHEPITAQMRAAVDGFNQFLGGAGSEFHANYQASDTDYAAGIPTTLMSLFFTWLLFRFWVRRRIEIDRVAKTVRLRTKRKLHPGTDESFVFSDIQGVSVLGVNWANLRLETTRGPRQLAFLGANRELKAQLEELMKKLPETFGVPLTVSPALAKSWKLSA
jgi:hypothetical protein